MTQLLVTDRLRPRTVRWLGIALVLGLAMAACTDEGDGTQDQPSPTVTSPATADVLGPTQAEILRVAFPSDEGPLNLFAQHEEALTELVYDKLLAPSPYVDEPQPWLAESVTQLDAVTWELALRDDVTWHDGQPFTANDVAATVELFKRAPAGRWTHHVTDTPDLERVEVLDETHLRIHCGYACPLLARVTLADLPMLPAHVWAEVDEPRARTELPVGTGPYRLVEYDATSGYVFEVNEDHFAGRATVDRLVMPIIEDPSTAFTALRNGEVDAVARLIPPELLDTFRRDPDVTVVDTAPLWYPELRLNFERPPLDLHDVRAALTLAVDRDALLSTVWLGQGRPATQGYMHPDSPWANPEASTPHDPQAAARLLDEAGIVDTDDDGVREIDGDPFTLAIKVGSNEPVWIRAAELLVEQFGAIGVGVSIERLDPGSIASLFRSRDFDAYIIAAPTHGVADPTQLVMSHESGYLWRLPDQPYPEMAALIEQWRASDAIADRAALLHDIQALQDRQPATIPLVYPNGAMAFRHDAFGAWVESPGYGLFHKWSLLPRSVANTAGAIVGSG